MSQTRFDSSPISLLQISTSDQSGGLAEMRTTTALDCEAAAEEAEGGSSEEEDDAFRPKKSYRFKIEAISCSGTYSER